MAYLRRRGNQLAIVHGEREPGTNKVQQRILFTIYSKAEALEILGKTEKPSRFNFESLFQNQFPDIKVNWNQVRRGIEESLDVLPDLYQYQPERLRGRFRDGLCAFARQLFIADPQHLMPSAHLIQEHRLELRYLESLIQWRLKLCEQQPNQWNEDNPFFWRFELQGRDVPPDAEEHAAGFYERGEYEMAEAIFRLLIDCFDGYAEGHNYLGLIAYEQRRLEDAIGHFEKTMVLGRKLFPEHISKKRYWRDHVTRPYMRGLRNLALTLNEAGRFDECLEICGRLENECGDELSAASFRADVYLNTREWQEAAAAAHRSGGDLDPAAGFVEAFALFELRHFDRLLSVFLRAALRYPCAARMLASVRTLEPRSREEARDHNTGVMLHRHIHAFLSAQSRASKKFFRDLVRDPRVANLLDEAITVVRRWEEEHHKGDRTAFDRMHVLHSQRFADAESRKLSDLLPVSAERRLGLN